METEQSAWKPSKTDDQVNTKTTDNSPQTKPKRGVKPGTPSPLKGTHKPLNRRQQAFVQELVNNPGQSSTKAYMKAYGREDRPTASAEASRALQRESIIAELIKHSNKAEMVLVEVMETSTREMKIADRDRAQWAVNARQTADSILDRVHGKATQRVEATSQVVTINVDLSGSMEAST